jgi:signal transduction histidine kinase
LYQHGTIGTSRRRIRKEPPPLLLFRRAKGVLGSNRDAELRLSRFLKWRLERPALFLALAAFAPLAAYAAFNGYISLKGRQTGADLQAIASTRSLSENIDREINAGLDEARALADDPALDPAAGRSGMKVFEEVMRRARLRHPEWLDLILLDTQGQWIFSADHSPLRKATDIVSLREAVRTGKPGVGDIVRDANGRWGIPLRAPVVRDGKVIYVVTAVTRPQAIHRLVANLNTPPGWVVLVSNAQGRAVARSSDEDRVLGMPLNAQARAARAGRPQGGGGTYPGRAMSGDETRTAFWLSPTTHWSTHVAIPLSLYEAPLRQMALTLLGGFAVCLLLALTLVILWIRDYETRRSHVAAVEQATRIDALGRLTGGVAHDFNNLLTVIQGNAEILARRLSDMPQADRSLAAIRTATDRAAKLTRQLLVFARGGPTGPVILDLAAKINDLLAPMAQLVGAGVVIDTSIEADLPPISIDPLQLEAALLNLAANARDAMGGAGRMEIRLRRVGEWVALIVRDEGPGFDPSALPRVFDPFFTTKPVGQGTGLGLSQVYGLMKGAGGQVEASNPAGGGGMVSLLFPASPVEAAPVASVDPPFTPPDSEGREGILLVDDHDGVRATTAAFLRECGLPVIEASDAAHALRILESAHVEAVVTDITMPGEMDGIGLVETIRNRWPSLPVLLVSGYSERAADAQARGFSVLDKPYSLPEMEQRLRALTMKPPSGLPLNRRQPD